MIKPTSAEIKTQSDINKLVLGYYNSRREVMVGYLGGMNPESKPHTTNSTISWAKASSLSLTLSKLFLSMVIDFAAQYVIISQTNT